MALMEEYVNGRTDNLHDYLIPTVGDVPPITVHLIEDPEPLGPWGAKGVGEPALVATAPAILNAIHAATGVRMREVPVTPAARARRAARGGGDQAGLSVERATSPEPVRARTAAGRATPATSAGAWPHSRARADGRRQGPLRSLPGAVPDQPGQARRLRPLRQRRRRADAHRHAAPDAAARHRPGRPLAGEGGRLAPPQPSHRADAPVFVSGIGPARPIPTTSRRPSSSPRSTTASTWSPSSPKASSATAASR